MHALIAQVDSSGTNHHQLLHLPITGRRAPWLKATRHPQSPSVISEPCQSSVRVPLFRALSRRSHLGLETENKKTLPIKVMIQMFCQYFESSAHEPKWVPKNCAQLCTTSSISYNMLHPAIFSNYKYIYSIYIYTHYITKSMWTPACRTSHSRIMGINMGN